MLIGAVSGTLYAQGNSDREKFLQKARACHMEFSGAAGYREVKVDTAMDVRYDYSLSDPGRSYEVRYKINPWPGESRAAAGMEQGGGDMFYRTNLAAICFDIARTRNMSYQPFPREYIRQSVNADMGGRALLKGVSAFSKGFEHVYLLTFYKQHTGLIYVFYLFNGLDTAALGKVVKETAGLLKFSTLAETPVTMTAPGHRTAEQEQKLRKFYIDSMQVTEVQADSLVTINERYAALGHALKTDTVMAKRDKINKLLDLARQKDAATRKVLSATQYEKWKKIKSGQMSRQFAAYSK